MKKMRLLTFASLVAFANFCSGQLIEKVNVFIGTNKMGHTFPGATAPFGMVQLSPETKRANFFNTKGEYNSEVYNYCAGYQYQDSVIQGFAHTHFSGTGHSDLGDFLVMPTTGNVDLKAENFQSSFQHKNEKASPGFYSVMLDDHKILAELTASDRVGFHRYTFPQNENPEVVLDFTYNIYNYDGKNVWTFIRVENDSLITGYRITSGWAKTRTVYFAAAFSQPISNYTTANLSEQDYKGFYRKFNQSKNFPEAAGKEIRMLLEFEKSDSPLQIKWALSNTSTEGALKNLRAEIPHWNFDLTKKETQAKWERELEKVTVQIPDKNKETVFYTALYHTCLSPVLYEDVDGNYKGLDQNIHNSEGFENYTVFSLWDTYRALHPLFNLIQPTRNNNMIHSMLAHQKQSVHDMLPVWSHYANENWCMTGYHAVSVIADAAVKQVGNFNLKEAYKACDQTACVDYFEGLKDYIEIGFVPEDKSGVSVSKTLEYAYDDWCIAQLSSLTNKSEVTMGYAKYFMRSESYRNVFNSNTGFTQPKLSNGEWKKPFDPLDTHGQGFIEGNSWNFSLYIPHAIPTMIELMGGKKRFEEHLDSLFTMHLDDKYIEKNEDITRDGIMGNYVHGNEPSHHVPYLYNYTSSPWKTQERVHAIANKFYTNETNGLCGNDDAGQMSAWYVFSALGIYPTCPGSVNYVLGSPLVNEAFVKLENGKAIQIKATKLSDKNIYVKSVKWNSKEIGLQISHLDLVQGGVLEFEMTSKPKKLKK
jgi:predicted alpha-1,2-mannosidase